MQQAMLLLLEVSVPQPLLLLHLRQLPAGLLPSPLLLLRGLQVLSRLAACQGRQQALAVAAARWVELRHLGAALATASAQGGLCVMAAAHSLLVMKAAWVLLQPRAVQPALGQGVA